MIDKKLIHFNTKETFNENKDRILDSSIVFIKDANEIHTHGETYQFIQWSYLNIPIPEGYSLYETEDGVFYASDGPFLILENEL